MQPTLTYYNQGVVHRPTPLGLLYTHPLRPFSRRHVCPINIGM